MSARAPFFRRSVYVTGATGLLGGWLVRRLVDQGAAVVALVRDERPASNLHRWGLDQRIDRVRGTLEDQALQERILAEYEVETVFHLAAQTLVPVANRAAASTFSANVAGSVALFEAARRCPTLRSLVFTSSDKAYGDHGGLPYVEEMDLRGGMPYEASKAAADLIAQSYARAFGLPIGVSRAGNLFGGGDLNPSRIVPGTIRALLDGERPVIRSDGRPVRDYLYVEDAVDGLLAIAGAVEAGARGRAWNLSSEEPRDVVGIVAEINAVMGLSVEPVVLGGASAELPFQTLNARRARAELGWRPRFGLRAGLAATVDWHRQEGR